MLKSAGFVIFRRNPDIEYLFLQASYGQNQWSPPKGQVDEGESEYVTAVRETQEEAGILEEHLKVHKDISKTMAYVNRKGIPKTVTYWLAEMVKDTPIRLSEEHQDFKWFDLKNACDRSVPPDLCDMLNECHQRIAEI